MNRTLRVLGLALVAMAAMVSTATAQGGGPANDLFASAQVLPDGVADVTATNAGATRETGEPAHAGRVSNETVWFSYTAQSARPILIETCGSSFDTVLAVYTGSAVNALTPVIANDDRGQTCSGTISDATGGNNSAVHFTPVSGTVYKIAVSGYNSGDTGTIDLDLKQGPIPANDSFASATAVTGPTVDVTGSNISASKETGEPNHAGNAGGASIWYSWSAPAAGEYTIETCGSSFNTLLHVYTGSAVGSLTSVVSNDNSGGCLGGGGGQSRVTVTAPAAGQVYKIAVDGATSAAGQSVNAGPSVGSAKLKIASGAAPVAPPNDSFSSPEVLTGATDSFTGNNAAASTQAGEPNHSEEPATSARSTWFTWTAPSDGSLSLSLCDGTTNDSVLAVYTGSTLSGLVPVEGGRNDNGCPDSTGPAKIEALPVVKDRVYRIAVAAQSSAGLAGAYTLNLSFDAAVAPPNDSFSNAEVLTGTADSFTGTNLGATNETGEPDHTPSADYTSARSVWFAFTAPADGEVTILLCDSPATADSVLQVYTGTSVTELTKVDDGYDDDGCGPSFGPSRLSLIVTKDTTYRIAVADFEANGGIQGPYKLDFGFSPSGPTQECLDAQADLADAEDRRDAAATKVDKAKAALKKAKKSKKAKKIKKAKAKLKAAKDALSGAETDVEAAQATVDVECQ